MKACSTIEIYKDRGYRDLAVVLCRYLYASLVGQLGTEVAFALLI